MNDPPNPPRYTTRELPRYSFVPGQFPHPLSDPAGHSYGHPADAVAPIDEANWASNAAWLWAIDLFNQGYYWEAHEAWEGLWHAAGRRGPTADFLKGLIKLAAASVKACEGNPDGVKRHTARAKQLLESSRGQVLFGITVNDLLALAGRVDSTPTGLPEPMQIWLVQQDPEYRRNP